VSLYHHCVSNAAELILVKHVNNQYLINMTLVLDVGKYQISSDRVIEQLSDSKLLPQLREEMRIDDLVDRTAQLMSIDLTYTQAEFDQVSTELIQLPYFPAMNSAQLAGIVERRIKLEKFKKARWAKEILAYFDSQVAGLDRVVISILQVSDALLAQELNFRIQAGEQSFTEVVIDYSQSDNAEDGGVIGPLFIRDLPPGIGEIISQLQPGQISSLFQIDLLYTYFRLDELLPAKLEERMENYLLDELFTNWVGLSDEN
jgi:parvulin-like peptidyl-prolyl isomerase